MSKFIEWFDLKFMKYTEFYKGKVKNEIYEDDCKIIIKQETGYEWFDKNTNKKIFINGVIIETFINGYKFLFTENNNIVKVLNNPLKDYVSFYRDAYKVTGVLNEDDWKIILGRKTSEIILKIGDDK